MAQRCQEIVQKDEEVDKSRTRLVFVPDFEGREETQVWEITKKEVQEEASEQEDSKKVYELYQESLEAR